ncbi:MAG: TerC/Alx family metal homeostasis membrane protein [Myxococcales bacterium FL481]|nr:MAG: TerC/Alx family metal homeostasis membrane protein [Myxococcales bacterium FL481]
MELYSVGTPGLWFGFLAAVLLLLIIDVGVLHRQAHRVRFREALGWSVFWVALSLSFNGYLAARFGSEVALEFLAAYLIEKSLSVDNIFVFVVVLRYMKIRPEHAHRVLFAGIVGALVLRGIFIFVGLSLIEMFRWSLYVFGGFLLYTGLRLLWSGEAEAQEGSDGSFVRRQAERWLRVTNEYDEPIFFLRRDGRLWVTTLFVTLLMIETADVIFALDSIPAIFGISSDPFIIFTSNVCAVLGLRAMFFLLEQIIDRFRYLSYGLGLVLAFVGAKMILAEGLGGLGLHALGLGPAAWLDPIHVPIGWSLALVGSVLTLSILASLLRPPNR